MRWTRGSTQVVSGAADRLEGLQALRAMAAGMVVLTHGLRTFDQKVDGAEVVMSGLSLGDLGVKLFFCISGYIIIRSALGLGTGGEAAKVFLLRRLIRILPLYWAATLVYALKLSLQGETPMAREVVYSMLFIPYADETGLMRPVLGLGWTLNFEMVFYAVVAVSMLLVPRWRFGFVASVFGLLLYAPGAGLLSPAGHYEVHLALLSDHRLLLFLGGMGLGLWSHRWGLAGCAPWGSIGGVVVSSALLLAYLVFESRDVVIQPIERTIEWGACMAAVSACVAARVEGGERAPIWRRWMVAAGDGSYSTYLLHGFVMGPAARVVDMLGWDMPQLVFGFAMVGLCTAAGVLSYRYFELPVGDVLKRQWLGRRRTALGVA